MGGYIEAELFRVRMNVNLLAWINRRWPVFKQLLKTPHFG